MNYFGSSRNSGNIKLSSSQQSTSSVLSTQSNQSATSSFSTTTFASSISSSSTVGLPNYTQPSRTSPEEMEDRNEILNAEPHILCSNSINISPNPLEKKAGGSGLNALSASPDSRLIAVGGRKLFRIVRASFQEDEKKFKLDIPITIYYSGKKSMDFAVVDLKWHPTLPNVIATAPPNGKVILWNVNSSSKSGKIITRFNGHECTVNSLCWQPHQENLLLSASVDHTCRLWDKRQGGDSVHTFNCGSVVRSIKFNTFFPNVFAAATDGGDFQVWDIRKPNLYQKKIPAHNGLILSLDWHPKKGGFIATGGRDRVIKVWDLNDTKKPISTVQTIASIAKIAWRPGNYNYHLASCAKNDVGSTSNINLWDISSRYVPLLSFTGQRADVTDIAWMNNYPNLMMSCSKDNTFMIHSVYEAEYEKASLPTSALSWNINNELVHANDEIDRQQHERYQTILQTVATNPPSVIKQINRETEMFTFKEAHIDKSINISKNITQDNDLFAESDVSNVKYLAENYDLFSDDTYQVKCDRNAFVASSINNYKLEKLWKLVKDLHTPSTTKNEEPEILEDNIVSASENTTIHSNIFEDSNSLIFQSEEGDDTSEEKYSRSNSFDNYPSNHMLYSPLKTPSSFHNDTLNLSTPPTNNSIRKKARDAISQDFPQPPKLTLFTTGEEEKLKSNIQSFDDMEKQHVSIAKEAHSSSLSFEDDDELESLYESSIQETIEYYAEMGDIQTCVSLIEVLDKKQNMSGEREAQWYLSYIELLNRHKLFTCANELINGCTNYEVHHLNKQSTSIRTSCGKCDSLLQNTDTTCKKCSTRTNMCVICHLPVDGLFYWCQRCGNGGHLNHMCEWFAKYKHCPVCLSHVSKLQTLT
ncbi:WD repeat domain 24 [Naegleria gruberi]|uniref:WD repeat domain 24 n=1 Tax=Naegleria gruberi TaxID=5762 RepID=D2V555_NAEGR|nr:WD repeat domain 24 [Naegleria gruberi]EFC48051.1 WD repeat domain 24 [Naegleria gruberi]|eukprot:XP_002680795.1 WD repeat domain 24 [Naegleria gruberi strain NEG-M]